MKEYQVFQTQHRLDIPKEIKARQAEGYELLGPVQFCLYGQHTPQNPATYYLATFVRETDEN